MESLESLGKSDTMIQEKFKKPSGEVIERVYYKGRMIGEGGFAQCYEFTNMEIHKVYAAKIISKAVLKNKQVREKVSS
jgi:polo-like kinase 1